jgi:hypothetical protein
LTSAAAAAAAAAASGVAGGSDAPAPAPARKRIPCPVDPTHTVFEDAVRAHLRVCATVRRTAEVESAPYFVRGVNAGCAPPAERAAVAALLGALGARGTADG